MVSIIDVHDLAGEEIEIVEEFVNKLRERKNVNTSDERTIDEIEPLKTRRLGVKGNVTRKEIYDCI